MKRGTMTPTQIRNARFILSMDQMDMGVFCTVTMQTVANWEKGRSKMPLFAEDKLLLRLAEFTSKLSPDAQKKIEDTMAIL